jgi:hypothetical protein
MKKLFNGLAVAIGIVLFGAFTVNSCIRVSDSKKDWGIVENLIWGRPFWELLLPPWSDDYKRWDAASKAVRVVTDIVQRYGIGDLALNPDLTKKRQLAQSKSEEAYTNAAAISPKYLANSNPDLPIMYFESFVPAMDLLNRGFKEGNVQMLKQGVSAYNDFLIWMQSHDQNEFKPLK